MTPQLPPSAQVMSTQILLTLLCGLAVLATESLSFLDGGGSERKVLSFLLVCITVATAVLSALVVVQFLLMGKRPSLLGRFSCCWRCLKGHTAGAAGGVAAGADGLVTNGQPCNGHVELNGPPLPSARDELDKTRGPKVVELSEKPHLDAV